MIGVFDVSVMFYVEVLNVVIKKYVICKLKKIVIERFFIISYVDKVVII